MRRVSRFEALQRLHAGLCEPWQAAALPRRNREGLNVVELCSGDERTNGGPPCAATVGAYEQMVVCTENSVLIDYVTESPNVTGDDRSVMLFPDPVGLAVQVEEPT
jgi:hypothetical protein